MPRQPQIDRLEEHPNLEGILGVLSQLSHITDGELVALARAWRNTPHVAEARRRALSPDSPLVVEVLAAFDALTSLFADDLAGSCEYVTVDPAVTTTALKAVRDGIAAAYARPILSRGEYGALIGAWQAVYPRPRSVEPDLGPAASEVKLVLGALPMLAGRCHDEEGRRVYDGLLVTAMTLDEMEHQEAVDLAFRAAVATGRRRVWALVRRSAAEGLGRMCPSCRRLRRSADDGVRDDERVFALCADAACGLLVRDAVDTLTTARLTAPLTHLVPLQRRAAEDSI